MNDGRVTSEEFAEALRKMAPAMDAAWKQAIGDEETWRQRIDGPEYRSVPILGRYRWYRKLRAWWLRRQLRG